MKKLLLLLTIAAVSAGSIKAVTQTELINAKCDAKLAKIARYGFDCAFVGAVAFTAGFCTGPAGLCTVAAGNSWIWAIGMGNMLMRYNELELKNHFSKLKREAQQA